MKPTQEEIKDILDYNPDTGVFIWRKRTAQCIHVGDLAGHIRSDGYRVIKIGHKAIKAHRLAWLYVYGAWPTQDTDHINGIKDDNRIVNLRDVSHRVNGCNRKKNREGGLAGVYFNKASKDKWGAQAQVNGKHIHIGRFKTPEEAHKAYVEFCGIDSL